MKKFISIFLVLILFCGSVAYADNYELYSAWDDSLKTYTKSVCKEHNVPYELVVSIIDHESRFKSHVSSSNGTYIGLMQIGNTKDIRNFLKNENPSAFGGDFNLYDPKTNILAGVTMLEYYIGSSKTIEEAVCKYGCGEGNYSRRMKNNQGYCKPSVEIVSMVREYQKKMSVDSNMKFLQKELEKEKSYYHDLHKEYDTCAENMCSYYEEAMILSLQKIQLINNELSKYDSEV